MGKIIGGHSERKVASLSKVDGMHCVGGIPGLYLVVDGNARSWILRYSLLGRRREMGLGAYSDLSLADVREVARAKRRLVRDGIDPIDSGRAARQATKVAETKKKTLAECVDGVLQAKAAEWRNAKHAAQWRSTLETYVLSDLGEMDVAAIDTTLVHKVLDPIWITKNETARRVRGRLEAVLDWATVRGFRSGPNPARWRGHLDSTLARPSKVQKVAHHPALPWGQIGEFMKALRNESGIGALALEFVILTAARSGEVRGAKWDEIDLAAKTWTVPADRMKAGAAHVVPLSDQAIAIIRKQELVRQSDFVFPGAREARPLSDMALVTVLRRMDRTDIVPHGFRSTFRDWAAEHTDFPNHVVEMALAHQVGNAVEAAYRRGALIAKRAVLMNAWAAYCAEPSASADVLQMTRKAGK